MTTITDLIPDAAAPSHMEMWLDSVAATLERFGKLRNGEMTDEEVGRWFIDQLEAELAEWEANNTEVGE